MSNQVQISLDQKVYDRLIQLKVAPCRDINDVIELEAEGHHYTLAEEIERTKAGVYDSAGS